MSSIEDKLDTIIQMLWVVVITCACFAGWVMGTVIGMIVSAIIF